MHSKIKGSYKQQQLLKVVNGVSVYLTTKAKSKHSLSFTYTIFQGTLKLRDIHHRITFSECEQNDWVEIIHEKFPDTKPFRPKKEASTKKEKKFKHIDEILFKKGSGIFT